MLIGSSSDCRLLEDKQGQCEMLSKNFEDVSREGAD